MSKATLTIEGFIARDPETRDHNGQQVATVTVPHTPRRKNRDTGQFEDAGDTLWVQASFWGDDAAAIIQTARKGELVTITGQPELNVYTKNDGTAAASLRLKFATLGIIPRATKSQPAQQRPQQWAAPAAQPDAWAPGGVGYDETAPF